MSARLFLPRFFTVFLLGSADFAGIMKMAWEGNRHMNTITRDAFVSNNHKLSLDLELPADAPTGDVVITVTVTSKNTRQNACGRIYQYIIPVFGFTPFNYVFRF